jgi:hypothetical protein
VRNGCRGGFRTEVLHRTQLADGEMDSSPKLPDAIGRMHLEWPNGEHLMDFVTMPIRLARYPRAPIAGRHRGNLSYADHS